MGVNSLPKTVTRQRRDCDLNPGLLRLSPTRYHTRLPIHLHYWNPRPLFHIPCTTFIGLYDDD